MTGNQQLLEEYARNGSETAFRELVGRYINFVYSTALRLVNGNSHLAEDVTQMVFICLAQQGRTLSGKVMLGGWLHQSTYHIATKAMRTEQRRQIRENEALQMNALSDDSEAAWQSAAPLLDEAINQLGAEDRTAILLRFFEQQDFRVIGEALGNNEDAARMRVNRALEKLHGILKHRGVALSVGALGTALAGEAVTAAPAGLAMKVVGAALSSAATSGGAFATFIKYITMTKLHAGIIGAIAATAIITPLAIQQKTRLSAENEMLRRQNAEMTALASENASLSNQITHGKNSQALTHQQLEDLLKLRSEVSALKRELTDAKKDQAQPPSQQPAPLRTDDPAEQQRQEALKKL